MRKSKSSLNDINNERTDIDLNNKYKIKYQELHDTNKKLSMEINRLKSQIVNQNDVKDTMRQQKDDIVDNLENNVYKTENNFYKTQNDIYRTQLDILKTRLSTMELSIQNDSSKIFKLYRFLANISMRFN